MRKRKEASSPVSPVRVSPRKKKNHEKERDSISKPHSSSSSQRSLAPEVGIGASNSGQKDYTSDGMSFESVVEDDDVLPDISLASPHKDKKYVRDDIVWAPWYVNKIKIHWPALVTSVKWPYVCYSYINEPKKPVYKKHHTRLISFDNSSRNLSLKEEAEKVYVDVIDAYELVVKYLCKKSQDPLLNARRFLILSHHDDKIGQAKDCLFRLTGKLDSSKVGDDDDEDGVELFSDDESSIIPCMEDTTQSEDNFKYKVEDAVKVKILKDLETLPPHMTVSSAELEKLREEALKLLNIIRSDECFNHLMQIREEITPSSRHTKFLRNQEVRGCFGPFTLLDDLTGQLLTVLDNHCDECGDEPEYKLHVMLPEAIIYAIGKLKNCEKLTAKKYFNLTSKKVGVQD